MCLPDVGILTVEDKTNLGQFVEATFLGELRSEQVAAIEELENHRCGTIYTAMAQEEWQSFHDKLDRLAEMIENRNASDRNAYLRSHRIG